MLPRNDSTSARTDSTLRLVAEDSEWELWQDSTAEQFAGGNNGRAL
jgi:hypothetical protein